MPSIFTTCKLYCDPEPECGLRLLAPLTPDACCSVFRADLTDVFSGSELHYVAKLVYRHYGVVVHQELEKRWPYQESQAFQRGHQLATFAPKLFGWSQKPGINTCLYIMEYLLPPYWDTEGWLTLTALGLDMAAQHLTPIYQVLKEIVAYLTSLELVHGDLRPNNLMIKMQKSMVLAQPVQIKVVDFEWAGKVGFARYPHNRNEDLGYPGKPGDLIGRDDDLFMIKKWFESMEEYKSRNPNRRASTSRVPWAPLLAT